MEENNGMYRARVQKEVEKLQAGEVFGTPPYLKLMKSIAKRLIFHCKEEWN